jgi:hypothetical protein
MGKKIIGWVISFAVIAVAVAVIFRIPSVKKIVVGGA